VPPCTHLVLPVVWCEIIGSPFVLIKVVVMNRENIALLTNGTMGVTINIVNNDTVLL
jgi:hypothetical protein